jgi:hypothetical protein
MAGLFVKTHALVHDLANPLELRDESLAVSQYHDRSNILRIGFVRMRTL